MPIAAVSGPLDPRAARKPGLSLTMVPPVPCGAHERQEPQERACEVHPDRILHALHAGVALGILVDVHFTKYPKEYDPEDKQHEVPGPDQPEAQDKGYEVEDGCEGGYPADDLRIHPFRVNVLALRVGTVQVHAI